MPRTFEDNFRDTRTQKVLGFLIAKGLLIGEDVPVNGSVKLDVEDVLWVGANVEPRVLEVFPAALIHFPRTFMRTAQIPAELADVITAIKAGNPRGPDFRGLRYRDMRKWANKSTSDGRTKPLSEIRINKTFRLSPKAVAALEKRSKQAGLPKTRFLEKLLLDPELT